MKNQSRQSRQTGIFTISPGQKATGTLILAGLNTSLYVWSEDPLDISSETTITGILDDLTKVSLIGCSIRSQGHVGKEGAVHYKCLLHPIYVIFGSRHFFGKESDIVQISFTLEHAVALFDDTDAYGTIFNNSEIIDKVSAVNNPERNIPVGDWNWISYYTGKTNVFTSQTVIGEVSANHSPAFSVGIASNSGLTKRTCISIKFDAPLTVSEAICRMGRVLQFFDIVVGYSQQITEIRVHTGFDHPSHTADLYSTSYADHPPSQEENGPSFHTILINPVHDAGSFSNVLRAWLRNDKEWRTARTRLSRVWGERVYDYDRIVAAANVFDLLPNDVYGANPPLPKNLKDAIEKARRIFRCLIGSDERNDVLGYLGRIGSWRLKKKIRHRAENVTEKIGDSVPEIGVVIDEAVNLRNFCVHGTPLRVKKNRHLELLSFLTNSLEFIFFTSDFIDAGWDITDWCYRRKPLGHPFHDYLVSYQENLNRLKKALK